MDEGFEIPVTFKGKDIALPARLILLGYTYRIEVDIEETTLSFERDEERNWRALMDGSKVTATINTDLVNAVIEALDSL